VTVQARLTDVRPELDPGPEPDVDPHVLLDYRADRSTAVRLVLGGGARLRSGTVLYAGSTIGGRFQTGHHVVVREECTIGDDVSIWSNSLIDYGCRIGDRVKIHTNCYVAQYTEILDDAFLAPGVTIANDLYPGQADSARLMSGPRIGAGAQIGVNVTLLPFVSIGDGCLVGSGSVVTRDLPDGTVAYGNPARVRGLVADLTDIAERVVPDPGSSSPYRARPRTSGP
jgi:acetyltransferase-like isoleucine patch superfamily enzyme